MCYTILLRNTFTHYDTFYYYIILASCCQGRFFIFVGSQPNFLYFTAFFINLHNSKKRTLRRVSCARKFFQIPTGTPFTFFRNHGILIRACFIKRNSGSAVCSAAQNPKRGETLVYPNQKSGAVRAECLSGGCGSQHGTWQAPV